MQLMKDFKTQVIDGFVDTFVPKKKITVEMIHSEFNSAGDKLLTKAKNVLATISKEKGERLKKLGFMQAKEINSVQLVDDAEYLRSIILDYSIRYPQYRFITEEAIAIICKKYNLVYGPIGKFKGFVPLEKLQAIEEFKKNCKIEKIGRFEPYSTSPSDFEGIMSLVDFKEEKDPADDYMYLRQNGNSAFQQDILSYDGIHWYGGFITPKGKKASGRLEVLDLQICAPLKDMDTTDMKLDGHVLKFVPKDPVVIQPVEGGGLIIAAWGDESSDPLVVNEKLN